MAKSSTSKRRSSPKSSAPRNHRPAARRPRWQDWVVTRKPTGAGTRGWVAIRWIETHCVHTNDRWTGRPFRLLTWQKWVVLALFTVRVDGIRVVRWALIGIAKKNGKTELCAALALFFAFGPSGPDGEPEPSALVIVAAGSDAQADTLFGACRTMVEQSPTLCQVLEVFEAEIVCSSMPGSKIRRVASTAKQTSSTLDGPNIYVVICDELHCWEGNQARVVWDTLTNGGVTRRQPMVLQITTAGFDKETICGEQYDYGKAVVEGKIDDPAFFFWWVEPPEGEQIDHRDPAVIEACNPSFGHIMTIDFYLDQLTKKTEAVFRRYFLDQWTESQETWLPAGQWDACNVGPFEFDPDADTWCGADAATKWDSTAIVTGQWVERRDAAGEVVRKLRLKLRLWERPWDARTRRLVENWRLPGAEVEDHIRGQQRTFGDHLRAVGCDTAHFREAFNQLEAEGLPMEDVPQTDARMVPAAQLLYQLVVAGRVEHDGDGDFARHIRNAAAVQARGGNGGWRLAKGKTKRKMDAAIAAAIVALLAGHGGEDDSSTYENRELVVL